MLKYVASLPWPKQTRLLSSWARQANVSVDELKARLIQDWRFVGRPKQQEPEGEWTFWLILAGRGFGKTITGAQWVRKQGHKYPGCRIALVSTTQGDVRGTMIEGETGLLNVLTNEELLGGSREVAWNTTKLELRMANGTLFQGFSAERPDRLRGPQTHFAWCEEASSWQDAHQGDKLNTTWNNLTLCNRLGTDPRYCITTTPKPNKLTKHLMERSGTRLVSGSSYENRDNLSEAWWNQIVAPLEGTRTGLQEIHAQFLDDVEGALWTRAVLDELRVEEAPVMARVIVAIDPQGSTDEAANEAGIIVCGKGVDGRGYVIEDCTPREKGPEVWGSAAVAAYQRHQADLIVAETNFGAAMVEFVIKAIDPTVAFKAVTASRGKRVRAEPISILYNAANPRAHHVGPFYDLETEMVTWTPGSESPNRMDALVWGMTELKVWAPPSRSRTGVPRGRIPEISSTGF